MRSQPGRLRILVSARPSRPFAWHLHFADASFCSRPTGTQRSLPRESRKLLKISGVSIFVRANRLQLVRGIVCDSESTMKGLQSQVGEVGFRSYPDP